MLAAEHWTDRTVRMSFYYPVITYTKKVESSNASQQAQVSRDSSWLLLTDPGFTRFILVSLDFNPLLGKTAAYDLLSSSFPSNHPW